MAQNALWQRNYYEKLRDIFCGNQTAFSAAYNDDELAKEKALALTRAVYGESGKNYRYSFSARGLNHSSIRGMKNDILLGLADYLANVPSDQVEGAKQMIEKIIAEQTEALKGKYIKTIASITLNKVSESEFSTPTGSVITTADVVKKINSVWKKAKDLSKFVTSKDVLVRATSVFGSATYMAMMENNGILRRLLDNTRTSHSVGCMLSYLPLSHIQKIEVARSGQVLKFRATGSTFLANQPGKNTDAVRISGYLIGDEIIYLIALFVLYYWGSAVLKTLDLEKTLTLGVVELRQKVRNLVRLQTERQLPTVQTHKTFPFVSRHVIIPNVYIETLSFEDKIDTPFNVINYDILLRTYEPEEEFKIMKTADSNYSYAINVYEEKLGFHKIMESAINIIWRTIQSEALVVNNSYWKAGVSRGGTPGSPQSRDVYYNIDAIDIASTFALGAMGFYGMGFLE